MCIVSLNHSITVVNEPSLLDQLHFRLESSIRLLLLKSLKLKVANLLIEQDKVDDNKVADTTNAESMAKINGQNSLPKI